MITAIERNTQLVGSDGKLTLRAAVFFEELTYNLNLNTAIEGTGSPEGVITADRGQRYMDTTGAAGSILYIKTTATGDTGWKLV